MTFDLAKVVETAINMREWTPSAFANHPSAAADHVKLVCDAFLDLAAPAAPAGSPDRTVTVSLLFEPVPLRLNCPECGTLHVDEGEWATKPHHTHACQSCGNVWRPAVVHTVGVRFLPGYKDDV